AENFTFNKRTDAERSNAFIGTGKKLDLAAGLIGNWRNPADRGSKQVWGALKTIFSLATDFEVSLHITWYSGLNFQLIRVDNFKKGLSGRNRLTRFDLTLGNHATDWTANDAITIRFLCNIDIGLLRAHIFQLGLIVNPALFIFSFGNKTLIQ